MLTRFVGQLPRTERVLQEQKEIVRRVLKEQKEIVRSETFWIDTCSSTTRAGEKVFRPDWATRSWRSVEFGSADPLDRAVVLAERHRGQQVQMALCAVHGQIRRSRHGGLGGAPRGRAAG